MELSLGVDRVLLLVGALVLLSVATTTTATRIAPRLRVPGSLLLLVVGMVVGDDALDLVSLSDARLVQDVGAVTLVVILFEGGLTTKPTDLRLAALPGGLLATLGVAVTAGVTFLAGTLLLDVEPLTAALIGAIVASTDAAAVFAGLRSLTLPRRLAAVLRAESGANDPLAVMLTVGLLAASTSDPGPGDWAVFLVRQLVGGLGAGLAVGALAVAMLRRLRLGSAGLYPIVALANALLGYGVATAFGGSGFLAVYVVGLLVGARVPRHRRSILGFHEAAANAADIGLFLLLGLLVFPSQLPAVALPALGVAAALTLVARPLAVWLCTLGQGFDARERAVMTVGGLKGAVPIVLSTLPLTADLPDAGVVFNTVFFVVLVSLLLQGTALTPLVQRLGLDQGSPAWEPVSLALPLDGMEVDLVELHLQAGMPLCGRTLAAVPPPPGAVVTAVVRDREVVVPRGATVLGADDVLLVTTQRGRVDADDLTAWARGELDAS